MASATLTYGKKRSLLKSIGSRRRQRSLIDSMSIKKSERLTPPVNAHHEGLKQGHRAKGKIPTASIEEIASALLDDSTASPRRDTIRQSDQGVVGFLNSSPLSPENSAPECVDEHLRSTSLNPSRPKRGHRGYDPRPRASRIRKSSSKSPGRMTARNRGRPGSSSSPSRKGSGLVRPIPNSTKVSPYRSNGTSTGDTVVSSLLPNIIMNIGPPEINEWKQSHPVRMQAAGPDEIQQKVTAMLAATDALKPSPSQMKTLSASKMALIVPSRVLAKVSSAWDRLHLKPSDGGQKPRSKLREQYTHDETDGLTSLRMPVSRSTSSINTIEIRLNEGDNLNRKKVQKIVGGRVNRKPVAEDGKSIRGGRSVEDPFAKSGRAQIQDLVDELSSSSTETKSEVNTTVSVGPFESEEGFEDNLQDRILSASPIGSSTPKSRAKGVQTPSSDDKGNKCSVEQPAQPDFETVTIRLTEYESSGTQTPRKNRNETGDWKHVRPIRTSRTEIFRIGEDMNPRRAVGMKKHPSPSKRALEDLQEAFLQYSELKKCGTEDELDELSRQYAPPRLLSPRDKNQMMGARLNAQDRKMYRQVLDSDSDPESPAKSRIPRSTENRRNWRPPVRLAPVYRPTIPHADETDKLQ
ncbi:hypothetical protein PT974_11252 [Cladobotryum mycophilum]|uniref:Uncharacterized protein n=1 Tax=Cladobotryum mycophilum TaxID=491253 RepID=A0ABR0S4Q6_9HYPO